MEGLGIAMLLPIDTTGWPGRMKPRGSVGEGGYVVGWQMI